MKTVLAPGVQRSGSSRAWRLNENLTEPEPPVWAAWLLDCTFNVVPFVVSVLLSQHVPGL